MSLPPHLESLKLEALRTSCIGWAIRKRWVLATVGIDRAGPCPVCGGKDRFSIHTTKDTFNCRQCGIKGHGVIDLVMMTEQVEFTKACEIVTGRSADLARSEPVDEAKAEQLRANAAAEEEKREAFEAQRRQEAIARASKICRRGSPVAWDDPADPVVVYLRHRGIAFDAGRHPKLGLIAAHPWIEKQGNVWVTVHEGPSMIAAIRRPDGKLSAVHQTWLDPASPSGKLALPPAADGNERAVKKVIGSKKGGAIRLFTPGVPEAVGRTDEPAFGRTDRTERGARKIVMGEGVETTLTAMAHNFEMDTAYWAGVDLGNMAGRDARVTESRSGPGQPPVGAHLWDQPDLSDLDCFIPPDWCEELVYLCDGDDPRNHTEEKVIRGLRRALLLRERARQENDALPELTVSYVPPLGQGQDLNDLVRVQ
jgi:hypothetical protein